MASIPHGAPPPYHGPGYIMQNIDSTRDFRSIDMSATETASIRDNINPNRVRRTRTDSSDAGPLPADPDESRDNRPLIHDDNNVRTEDGDTDYQPVNWRALNKIMFRPKYIPMWILTIAIIAVSALLIVYHDQAVDKLRPWAESVRDLPAGWLIPIVVLFVISFPPLFGHEIVALLCGVVWGLWIGFGIVAAGTFAGEIGTWFTFQKLLYKHCLKLERTNINYGALTRLARQSRFWFIFVVRFSAIPQHFSTAVFANCDISFWIFALATFLTLPKQLVLVYFGVLLVSKDDTKDTEFWIKTCVTVATVIITLVMGAWVYRKMRVVKKQLMREQEERRARKNNGAAAYGQV
ncbi:VTT domain-containing protein [Microdochium nivale]|nr:VTT domain-containing protein [Microdochium nivale]